ncbi:bifunctional ligase/repressor BirA [mine drainage metagenome]|uniref:Bifunctional ligase/repressor BirA n=1 Tax=mine drainage metagenome TaxID=410659 RepID=A0A1J5SFK9_9ZZZZ
MSAPALPETAPAWRILQLDVVSSTNDVAGKLPGWNAVVARSQLQGRGRYRRSWVSDEGGVWLSAVLPTPGDPEAWSILPLAAGWALRETMDTFGVTGMRLRWPNDLMVERGKLAGILVERYSAETAVVGIGINYDNSPEAVQPDLAGQVARLRDLIDPTPARETVVVQLLAHLAIAQNHIASGRASEMLPALNAAWKIGRVAVATPSSERQIVGMFLGVDERGRLLLETENGARICLPPNEVEILRELP